MKVTEAERKESTKRCCGNGCPQRDSAEHKEYAEALIGKRMTENNITNADRGENEKPAGKHRRMDAATDPNGILEEMKASTNPVP